MVNFFSKIPPCKFTLQGGGGYIINQFSTKDQQWCYEKVFNNKKIRSFNTYSKLTWCPWLIRWVLVSLNSTTHEPIACIIGQMVLHCQDIHAIVYKTPAIKLRGVFPLPFNKIWKILEAKNFILNGSINKNLN